MAQFHFDPDTYLQLMAEEVPGYRRLQDAVAAGARPAERVLELGTGTGETARRVLERHPAALLVGVDASPAMLARARERLPAGRAELREGRLEDPLPPGPFDLVVSALAVHHLDGPGKADLYRRIAGVLAPGGRVVVADLVVPDDPADVVTPVDGTYDRPSRADAQVAWLEAAGLDAHVAWARRDLAVIVGDLSAREPAAVTRGEPGE
jgi:tRNA (cmo5U34)-methyltransferase